MYSVVSKGSNRAAVEPIMGVRPDTTAQLLCYEIKFYTMFLNLRSCIQQPRGTGLHLRWQLHLNQCRCLQTLNQIVVQE